jgi:hypothetical protein
MTSASPAQVHVHLTKERSLLRGRLKVPHLVDTAVTVGAACLGWSRPAVRLYGTRLCGELLLPDWQSALLTRVTLAGRRAAFPRLCVLRWDPGPYLVRWGVQSPIGASRRATTYGYTPAGAACYASESARCGIRPLSQPRVLWPSDYAPAGQEVEDPMRPVLGAQLCRLYRFGKRERAQRSYVREGWLLRNLATLTGHSETWVRELLRETERRT